ncbi:uncharacterized protein LOC110930104 [Helianthus annuus]|uniref:uncharacterized protein LOC110930104 n=1 Tax=Helianthus annuus TaxID=4232 RepID=UPI000B8FB2D3|nr:uncharacterized protein LOC110930104 [Helianthus annuus]
MRFLSFRTNGLNGYQKSERAWREEQDRLATLKGLKKINMLHGPATCRLCGETDEDANHLFASCYTTAIVWQKVSAWCNIPPIYAYDFRDLLKFHKSSNKSEHKKKLVQTIVLTTCWEIWKARNDTIFAGKRIAVDGIFGELQSLALTWIKHRSKDALMDWESWFQTWVIIKGDGYIVANTSLEVQDDHAKGERQKQESRLVEEV